MDTTTLFIDIVISFLGYAYFSYGRKAPSLPAVICGMILMIFPYFVTSLVPMLIIGAVIAAIPFIISKLY